jgi:hypothetical protein
MASSVILRTPYVEVASRTDAAGLGKKTAREHGVKKQEIDVENYPSFDEESLENRYF